MYDNTYSVECKNKNKKIFFDNKKKIIGNLQPLIQTWSQCDSETVFCLFQTLPRTRFNLEIQRLSDKTHNHANINPPADKQHLYYENTFILALKLYQNQQVVYLKTLGPQDKDKNIHLHFLNFKVILYIFLRIENTCVH